MMRAKYTVVLRTLMEDPQLREKLDRALSTYPLYEQTSKEEFIPAYIPTREELNMKILNRYKYREIGFETIGRFLDELEISMNEIMPRYNQLLFSADQDFNVIWNVDYKKEIARNKSESNEATGTSSSTAQDTASTTNNVTSNNKHINTKTPQDKLSVPAEGIDSIDYADEAQWNKDNSNSSGNSTSTGSTSGQTAASGSSSEDETTTETTKGNFGVVSAQDLILKYRETIRNIEQEIIEDPRIRELFMLVY